MNRRKHPLRFQCTGCGQCCIGDSDHTVVVSRSEQKRIQQSLKITWQWFRRRYIERDADGSEGLRLESNGRCSFLGADHRCRIYAVRPAQCRLYPFWPELVASQTAWRREGRRCEGIGRGPVIADNRLRRLLKNQ